MARPRGSKPAQAQKGQTKKNARSKRLKPKEGDLIQLGSSWHMWDHSFGPIGRVIEVLDKGRVVCVSMTRDTEFKGLQLIVFTREPKSQQAKEFLPWAKSVINVRERVVERVVEVRPKRVVTSHDELAEVLNDGDDSEHVVVQLPPAKSAQGQAGHPSANKP